MVMPVSCSGKGFERRGGGWDNVSWLSREAEMLFGPEIELRSGSEESAVVSPVGYSLNLAYFLTFFGNMIQ